MIKNIIRLIFIICTILTTQGCIAYGNKKLSLDAIVKKKIAFGATLSSVNVANDQVTIIGTGFSDASIVKLTGNGVNVNLNINSQSDTQIVATATSALALLAGGTFDLIIGTADAQATYSITFTLSNSSVTTAIIANGAVTGAKIGVSANTGDFLKYNGSTWVGASVYDGQTYLGVWDASTHVLPTITNAGDYFIVSTDGTFGSPAVAYKAGDWIITDGYNWQKVGYSKSVSSFQGRQGIVTLLPADYVSLKDATTHKVTGSSINDLADIDLSTAPTDGQVLKYSTSAGLNKWIAAAAGSSGIALTDLSASAPVTYNSTTGVFAISAATTSDAGSLSSADKTKLDGLTAFPTSGDGLVERFSGTMGMRTCATGEFLIWYTVTGWTCTTSVTLPGTAAQSLGMSRNSTSNTAGNSLTLQASGATSGASDKSGGSLVLSSGTATGTGSSTIEFKTSTAGSSGTTDNTSSTKMSILGNGNVGIGTTSPSAKLDLDTAVGYIGNLLDMHVGGSSIFKVDSSGSVYLNNLSLLDEPYWNNGSYRQFGMKLTANDSYANVRVGSIRTDSMFLGTPNGGTDIGSDGSMFRATALGITTTDSTNGAGYFFHWDGASSLFLNNAANNTSPTNLRGLRVNSLIADSNIGIGTTTPAGILQIANSSAKSIINIQDNNIIDFGKAGDSSYNDVINLYEAGGSGGGINMFYRYNNSHSLKLGSVYTYLDAAYDGHQVLALGYDASARASGGGVHFEYGTRAAGYNDASYPSTLSFSPRGETGVITSLFLNQLGYVGIGTTSPSQSLEVVGNILASGTVTGSSDRRLKKDIRPIEDALEKLDSITGVKYFWIEPKLHNNGEQIGVIAQDVEKVFPQAVVTNSDGLKSVSYMGLVAPVIQAIKELHKKLLEVVSRVLSLEVKDEDKDREIKEANAKIAKLENENLEIKVKLLMIEKMLLKNR